MDLHIKQIIDTHYASNDHPALIIDLRTIRSNYQKFKSSFPTTDVHFALKSLTDKEVVKALAKEGCSFEVASLNELQLLGKILTGKQLKKVLYSNPAKSRRSIKIALLAGIRWFSVDSIEEIKKIGEVADSIKVNRCDVRLYLRTKATSKNSLWPLSSKFGSPLEKAFDIISEMIMLNGLKLAGFTFHVGSQCLDQEAWGNAILDVDLLIEHASLLGVITDEVLVNLGGGFPSTVTEVDPGILDKIADYVHVCVDKCHHRDRIKLAAEPGRFISSDAGLMASRVILRTSKWGVHWLYLDTGVYHGMIEPSQGIIGKVYTTFESEEKDIFTLAGPSCDSADVIPVQVELPSSIDEEDVIFIEHSGAYSMAYATGNADKLLPGFNGFLPPSVYYVDK